MARGAEACAAMVARADLRLAEAAVPDRPRHADISRSDYRSLFVQTRGVLKKELTAQLRTRRQMRHAKGGKAKNGQGHILDMVYPRADPPRPRIAQFLAIGKENSYRSKRHAHRDARRTPQPLYDARQASKEGHDDCGCRAR